MEIEIKGLGDLKRNLDRLSDEIPDTFAAAAEESSKRVVLSTVGLRKYPPLTDANRPPTPYYIRGRGTQTKRGNLGNSQRLGTQWNFRASGLRALIGNPVSYAKWVHGVEQARAMGNIGWRKLEEVAQQKRPQIQKVFNAWFKRLTDRYG